MWNDLDIYTKNNLMKIYNRHGISSLKDMQQHYDDFEQRQFAKGGYMNPYAYGGNMFLNGGDYNIKDNLTSSNVFRNYNDDFSYDPYDPVAKVNSLIEQQEVMNNINNGDKSYETFINDPFFDSTEINKRVERGYNQPFKTFNNLTSYDSPYLYKQPEDLNNKETTYDYSVNNSTTTSNPINNNPINNNPINNNISRNNNITTQSPTTNTQSPINNINNQINRQQKIDEYLTNLLQYVDPTNAGSYSNNTLNKRIKDFNDSHPYYNDVMQMGNDYNLLKQKLKKREYEKAKNNYLLKNNVGNKKSVKGQYYSELFDAEHPYYKNLRTYKNSNAAKLKKDWKNQNDRDLKNAQKEQEIIRNRKKRNEYNKALNNYLSRNNIRYGDTRSKEQKIKDFDKSHPYYGNLRKYR